MSAVRKSETSGEQLRRMCKNIADSITNPKEITAKEDHGKLVKKFLTRFLICIRQRTMVLQEPW